MATSYLVAILRPRNLAALILANAGAASALQPEVLHAISSRCFLRPGRLGPMVGGPVVPGFAGGREVQDFLPNGPFNRRFVVGQLPGHGHQRGGAVAVSVLSVLGELVDSATSRGGLALPVLVARATRRRPGLHDVGRRRGRWATGAGRRNLRQKRDKVEVSPVQDVDLLRPATHPGPRRVFLREARNGKVAGIAAKGANDGVAPSLEVQEGGRVAPAAATQLAADSFVGGSGLGATRIRID